MCLRTGREGKVVGIDNRRGASALLSHGAAEIKWVTQYRAHVRLTYVMVDLLITTHAA
jgi:hypothetical protein